jgi:cytochrome c55X
MQHALRMGFALVLLSAAQFAFAQDQLEIAAGAEIYQETCSACHGERAVSPGAIPDLRKLGPDERPKFDVVVTDGKGQMPAWGGVLSDEQIGQIWAYIRSRSN